MKMIKLANLLAIAFLILFDTSCRKDINTSLHKSKISNFIQEVNINNITGELVSSQLPKGQLQPAILKGSHQMVSGGSILILIKTIEPVQEIYVSTDEIVKGYLSLGYMIDSNYYRIETNSYSFSFDSSSYYALVVTSTGRSDVDSLNLKVSYSNSNGIGGISSYSIGINKQAQTSDALQVSLNWVSPNDLDLHVETPDGEDIFYDNRNGASGGSLDLDSNPACEIDGINNENITWGSSSAKPGKYIVRVDLWSACDLAGPFPFVVTVKQCNSIRTYTGSFQASEQDHGQAYAGRIIKTFSLCYDIKITKYWSDQFEGKIFNYLPGNAGSNGTNQSRILMGTRNDSYAYAKAELKITPENHGNSNIQVRFAQYNNGGFQIFGDGKIEGNIASVWMISNTFDQNPPEYHILAWFDDNNNKLLDKDEQYFWTPGTFAIVNSITYNVTLQSLMALINTTWWISESSARARAFFIAFLTNGPIEYPNNGGSFQSSPIGFNSIGVEVQKMLAYNVGVDLFSSSSPYIRSFFFGANSLLGDDIRNSDAFKKIILSILSSVTSQLI